jgi:hypothetical protein
MRKWSRYIIGVVAITGWLVLAISADAETCKLEAKQLDGANTGNGPAAFWFQSTRPQSFFKQLGGPEGMVGGPVQEEVPEFSKVITKEPSAYNSQHPFRGVAKLGSQYFGFVFDTAKAEEKKEEATKEEPAKQAAKSDAKTQAASTLILGMLGANKQQPSPTAFQRFYFDVNHNGDLTDDPVTEATMAQNNSTNYASSQFPSVSVKIEVDGAKIDYAFTMSVYSYSSTDFSYANASLSASAYREGQMVINGKNRRVVVVDSNSNGRYDDQSGIDDKVQLADGTVYPKMGDMMFIMDPAPLVPQGNPYDPSTNDVSHFVGKRVNVDGQFLDLKITPAGDQVTLEPSKAPVGYVVNPNKGYRAIVYGEEGFMKIAGDESGKAPLPVGEWKLASYTIEKKGEAAAQAGQAGSLADAVKQLIGGAVAPGAQPRISVVSARGKQDAPAVRVVKGQTVDLPFGEPYRPVVTLGYRQGADKASLSMSLVGCAGEVCTNMTVNGARPGKPKFTISTEKGEVVDTGNFEYG